MPVYHVERSILIKAPAESIKNALTYYRQWPAWSPWLIMERSAQLNYSEKQGEAGSSYSWKGDLVGEGSMKCIAIHDKRIDMKLDFITPFKSEADVYFELIEEGDATRVVWNMDGKLPFFLFFMVKMMKHWIGMDYERGLSMLKEYVETGEVLSRVEIKGITTVPAISYIGISKTCRLDEMGDVKPDCYKQLNDYLSEHQLPTDNVPFSIYHYLDKNTQKVGFTAAVPVPANSPSTGILAYGELPATEALQVDHFGRYSHLGNAWSTAISFARYKKIKLKKKKPMGFEFYPDDAEKVATSDLTTQVFLPLK